MASEMDRTPRYAPNTVIVARGCSAWTCPVIEHVAHPPGTHPASCINDDMTALEMKTAEGSRWYGFERVYINSELRMVVVGFSARDEVRRNWTVCKHP